MKGFIFIYFLLGSVAESLRLFRVHVPHYKFAGETAHLECDFELGKTRLYSVKWYKDDEEFYRYLPRFNPPINTHSVDGVIVDIGGSDAKLVKLLNLDLRSTGIYRCEVSAEAPSFLSKHGEGRMTVVHLPKEDPQITGNLQDDYQIGDVLDLNCTSSKSFPPAKISFYINDQLVEIPHFDPSNTINPVDNVHLWSHVNVINSLTTSTLRLRLRLSPQHFDSRGSAKIKCVASISTLYWQDGISSSIGDDKNNNFGTLFKKTTSSNEIDDFRFGSSSSTSSRQHYTDDNTRIFSSPYPFIFNTSSLVTVRGSSTSLHTSQQQIQLVSKVVLLLLFPWFMSL